jgi:FlaA1/EpsC-like NDP-sugar epimerase
MPRRPGATDYQGVSESPGEGMPKRADPLVQSLPDLSDIIAGKASIDELHDVDVSDLLGRDPVPPNPQLFASCIRGRCVMVTGAGGSIGSELCRQIMKLAPRRFVLFEMSELALASSASSSRCCWWGACDRRRSPGGPR